MSLQRKIEKIENQLSGSLPVQETPENAWAFNLARERFESPFDETARRVEEFFQNLKQEPSTDVIEDTPNSHYEPNPERRMVKVREYASQLVRQYINYEQYQDAMRKNDLLDKYFKWLYETDERPRSLGEPIY